MEEITIKNRVKNFTVKFVNDFDFIDDFLKIPYYVVVTGSVVYKLYKNTVFDKFPKERLIILNLSEERKTLDTVVKIYMRLLGMAAKKNLTIISFGGGTNQDISGFVASTLYRGINWIFVPTTLLAMADSAIGLKTSLNFHSYKNVLGTFYPPSEVYININFLKTLAKKDYYSGLGEIIKFFLMKEDSLKRIDYVIKKINRLKKTTKTNIIRETIKESIKIKLSYMKGDELDLGRRNLLNYGHELGHALEASSSFEIPHGIAVIIGIIFANLVSYRRGWLDKEKFELITNKILLPNVTGDHVRLKKKYFDPNVILEKLKRDKKRISEKLVLVLPKEDLRLIKIVDFDFKEFKKNLSELLTILKV